MFERKTIPLESRIVVQLLKKHQGLLPHDTLDLHGYAADKIEAAVLGSGFVPHTYRYHSHNPLTQTFIFIESADAMADKVMEETASRLREEGFENVQLDSTTTVHSGVNELIDAITSLHNQARDDANNGNITQI